MASPPLTDDRIDERVARLVSVGLWLVGVSAILAVLLLVALHLGDAYRADHASGVWMALAERLRGGELYPVLYDGEHFGGARYMPGPIVLYALAAGLGLDPVASIKVVDLAAMTALSVALFAILRGLGTQLPLALALVGGVLVTEAGLMSATGRSEAIPGLLQLGAVGLVLLARGRWVVVAAAGLCVLAVLCKVVAVYAPLAIGLWLLFTDRAAFVRFVATFVVGLVAALGLLHVLTEGRMAANFLEVSVSGITPGTVLRAPVQWLEQVLDGLPSTLVLGPFVLLAAIVAIARRSLGLVELALGTAFAILLVVMTDTGAAHNHHLDVVVLVALLVGGMAAAARPGDRRLVAAIGCAVIIGTSAGLLANVVRDVPAAVARTPAPEDDPHPLTGLIGPDDTLLSEDPTVPVTLGRVPVILDPVMLLRFQRSHPDWTAELVGRIDAGAFDKIVLLRDLDAPGADAWYRDWHLGTEVEAAIRRAYRHDSTVGRYHVYVPAGGG